MQRSTGRAGRHTEHVWSWGWGSSCSTVPGLPWELQESFSLVLCSCALSLNYCSFYFEGRKESAGFPPSHLLSHQFVGLVEKKPNRQVGAEAALTAQSCRSSARAGASGGDVRSNLVAAVCNPAGSAALGEKRSWLRFDLKSVPPLRAVYVHSPGTNSGARAGNVVTNARVRPGCVSG